MLESQIKLTKHLEEKLTDVIKEKDEKFIELRSEILVLERRLENTQNKLNAAGKDETVIEIEVRELRERIKDNEKLLDMQIANNKTLEFSNAKLTEQLETLKQEMFDYKQESKDMINSKNNELIDLKSRLSVIDQDYVNQINILVFEKNKLQSTIDIERSEADLLTMKLSVLSNKIKTVIEQKSFLLDNVESCIDNLKHEWTKLKEHCQRQMANKAVEQLEELLVLMINSFEGVKDVVKFMSFEELEIVGFQTQTGIESKGAFTPLNDKIGVGELDHAASEVQEEQSLSVDDNDSLKSGTDPDEFRAQCEDTSKQREALKLGVGNSDHLELSALVQMIKNKNEEKKMTDDSRADPDMQTPGRNDAFTKFTKTNFVKGRQAKLHKQLNPYPKNDEVVKRRQNDDLDIQPDDNKIDDMHEFVFPDLEKINFNQGNGEDFLSKHWIEIMEVLYGLISDIFLRIGNIQVSDEVSKLFTHIQN